MSNQSASPQKKKRFHRLKRLCVAFTAATVLVSGVGATAIEIAPLPAGQPQTMHVFGVDAPLTSIPPADMFDWQQMMDRQAQAMQNPDNAKQFQDFLHTFDKFKNEKTLWDMVVAVNLDLESRIQYSDTINTISFYYWDSPFQTEKHGAGDCKAFAALQYAIMQYLGVPKERLYYAIVGQGDNFDTTGADSLHVVLLINTAPEGQKPQFIVMNDGLNIADDSYYTQGHKEGWINRYDLIGVFNDKAMWIRNPLALAGIEISNIAHEAGSIIKLTF